MAYLPDELCPSQTEDIVVRSEGFWHRVARLLTFLGLACFRQLRCHSAF